MKQTILCIDTSTEACSVALWFQNRLFHQYMVAEREHAKRILLMIDDVLNKAKCSRKVIDLIAYGKGPGSFTGIRIGIGVAQGLGFGLNCRLIGISSLMALAQAEYRLNHSKYVISLIDARMNEVYMGAYYLNDEQIWVKAVEPIVISPEKVEHYFNQQQKYHQIKLPDFNQWIGVGTGWQSYSSKLPILALGESILPDSQDFITLIQNQSDTFVLEMAEQAEPLYLRNEVTWNKLPGR